MCLCTYSILMHMCKYGRSCYWNLLIGLIVKQTLLICFGVFLLPYQDFNKWIWWLHFYFTSFCALRIIVTLLSWFVHVLNAAAAIQFPYRDHESFDLSSRTVNIDVEISMEDSVRELKKRSQSQVQTSLLCPRRLKLILWGVLLSLLQWLDVNVTPTTPLPFPVASQPSS